MEDELARILTADLSVCKRPARSQRGGADVLEAMFKCVTVPRTSEPEFATGTGTKLTDLPQMLILEVAERLDDDTRKRLMFLNKMLLETYTQDSKRRDQWKWLIDHMVPLMRKMMLDKADTRRISMRFSKDDGNHKRTVDVYTRKVDYMDTYYGIVVDVYNDEPCKTELAKFATLMEPYANVPNKYVLQGAHFKEDGKILQLLQLLYKYGYTLDKTPRVFYFGLVKKKLSELGYCKMTKLFKKFEMYFAEGEGCALAEGGSIGAHVYTGARGGRYVIVNGRKKYV